MKMCYKCNSPQECGCQPPSVYTSTPRVGGQLGDSGRNLSTQLLQTKPFQAPGSSVGFREEPVVLFLLAAVVPGKVTWYSTEAGEGSTDVLLELC